MLIACAVPSAHANIREGLVGWWKLDETSGATAIDWSGQNNNGTYNGTTAVPAVRCKRNGCRYFNGTTDLIGINNSASLNSVTGTWSLWVKIASVSSGNGYGIMAKADNPYSLNGVTIISWNGDVEFYVFGPDLGHRVAIGGGRIDDLHWHHIAATFTSSGAMLLYQDGVQVGSGTAPSFSFTSQPLRLGRMVDVYFETFNGALDDVRVYNRILSAQEVSDLYRSGIVLRSGVWRNAKFNQ